MIRHLANGMPEPVLITLGCRLNAYESEVLRDHADAAGLDGAVIVNTCAVTEEAVRQAAQAIRRARREQPDARIIVTGCAAQTAPDRFAAMAEVDHVVGNSAKFKPAALAALARAGAERVRVGDIMAERAIAGPLGRGVGGRPRAYVQVQNGCDHRCTFCIIPFGRGPSRSVAADVVVSEVRRLVETGSTEIVLTGVDLTAYGAEWPDGPRLGALVRRVLSDLPELKRLRLSSIDHVEADSDLLAAFAEEERLMPHLHLSLQSGDDLILKRMKRRHSRGDAVRFCADVRRLRPDVAFGADLIAGFPTETEAMFQGSLDLVEDCGLTFLHVFPFSPRQGTPAARMPQHPRGVVRERAARLRERGAGALQTRLDAACGRPAEVLVESARLGRTRDFLEVELAPHTAGPLATLVARGHDGRRLLAEARS